LFDTVIPIYFSKGVPSFSDFLIDIAQKLGIKGKEFEKLNTEEKKSIIYNTLEGNKESPVLYLDSYETISDNKDDSKINEVNDTSFFINNEIPFNVFVFLTSRVKNNLEQEKRVDLEGLDQKESQDLFFALVKDDKLKEQEQLSNKNKEKIKKILNKVGGHPLSIELIAKNMMIENIDELSESLGTREINRNSREERLASLNACFDYSINKLDNHVKELLFNTVSLFKSPFSIKAVEEILDDKDTKNKMIDLFNKSLITRIDSDFLFGVIDDPFYYLYDFHPATKNYLERKLNYRKDDDNENKIVKFQDKFLYYYFELAKDANHSWGNENHKSSMARFNIISKVENNDIDRAIKIGLDSKVKEENKKNKKRCQK